MTDTATMRLADIRTRAREASTDWQFALTHEGETLTARVIPVEDPYKVLTFDKACTYPDRDSIIHAHADRTFLLELLDEAFAVIRRMRGQLPRPKKPADYAAECAMKCKDPDFQMFMHQVYGVDNPSDTLRVENRVKSMLQISSKKDLNENSEAANAWRKLVGEAEAWNKRRNRP